MSHFESSRTTSKPERVVLVGVDCENNTWPVEDSLAELGCLAVTDGANVVATLTQRLARPNFKSFIGSGKLTELTEIVEQQNADAVIFDDELSPAQQAYLESVLGTSRKILDRTALILDIFAEHATTYEGRLQVQLAQLQYLLPRLRGMWSHLVKEQTRGGIRNGLGSRFGQGESQLEVDRRLIRKKISSLKHEIKRLEMRRKTQRKARQNSGVYRIALAGYTNAGKSTLLNALTDSDIYTHDKLFATLDPTTRTFKLDGGRKVCITDTVGFIQKLPTSLIEAFKSTLVEVATADLILKVVDISDVNAELQLHTTEKILEEIGAKEIPSLVVFSKCDLLDAQDVSAMRSHWPSAEFLSSETGEGLTSLRQRIGHLASSNDATITAFIPSSKGFLINTIHECCQVIRETYETNGLTITAKVSKRMQGMLAPYVKKSSTQSSELVQ